MLTISWKSPNQAPDGALLVQVSRLELARARDVPGFLLAALQIRRAALQMPGSGGLSLRADPRRRTFWTLSAWSDQTAIASFMRSDAHRTVMAKYRNRVAGSHFHTWVEDGAGDGPPSWDDAERRFELSLQPPIVTAEQDVRSSAVAMAGAEPPHRLGQ
jgi:hypothetical protein